MTLVRLLTSAVLIAVLFMTLMVLVIGGWCMLTLAAMFLGTWVWGASAVVAFVVFLIVLSARLGGGQKAG